MTKPTIKWTRSQLNIIQRFLTPRQEDVIKLKLQGYKDEEIAQILHISKKTVSIHITNVYQSANISNVAQLSHLAVQLGIYSYTAEVNEIKQESRLTLATAI